MGNIVGELTGANKKAARAAQGAATAQEEEARRISGIAEGELADLRAAANDPRALANIERQLRTQESSIQRQEQLISQISPEILAASEEALKLIQGEESRFLDPLRRQRQDQRRQLLNTLREQGFSESSSAAQQALQNFDLQTSGAIAQTQQTSLDQLSGISRGGLAGLFSGENSIGQGAANAGQLAGLPFMRRQQATQAGLAGVIGAGQQTIQSAGSRFVGQSVRAQQQRAVGGELAALSGEIGKAVVTGGTSAAPKPGGGGTLPGG